MHVFTISGLRLFSRNEIFIHVFPNETPVFHQTKISYHAIATSLQIRYSVVWNLHTILNGCAIYVYVNKFTVYNQTKILNDVIVSRSLPYVKVLYKICVER